MDDDFCSIVNGIEEGRVLFDNLTKTIAYTLTHLLPELVSIVIQILFSIPYGMSSLMILSIDLLSEVPPAISFAWERSESNVMERPPRNRKVDRLVRPALLGEGVVARGRQRRRRRGSSSRRSRRRRNRKREKRKGGQEEADILTPQRQPSSHHLLSHTAGAITRASRCIAPPSPHLYLLQLLYLLY
jgi:hypothetical protein